MKLTPLENSNTTLQGGHFDSLLYQSIDEAMRVLGDAGKQAIYYYLEKSFSVKKEDFAAKVDVFSSSLVKIFGIGSNFIFELTLRILSQKLDMDSAFFDLTKQSFPECISIARKNFDSRKVTA